MLLPTRLGFALVLALLLGLSIWAVARGGDAFSSAPPALRVATWNLQWLMDPETARIARIACRERRRAPVPCDVARTLARDSADFGRLAATVRRLDADVIAFQEVESVDVARRVFRGHRICLHPGPGVQHAGFAIRRHWPARCESPLPLAGGGRPAQPLTLHLPDGPPLHLLSVHLKSGCARDPLDSATDACQLLQQQAGGLGDWIAARDAADEPFLVLGDLNRGGEISVDDAFWSLLHPASFATASQHLPFRNCVFGAPYVQFIDHILVARSLLPRLTPAAFEQTRFDARDAMAFRLSDHCPVSVSLSVSETL